MSKKSSNKEFIGSFKDFEQIPKSITKNIVAFIGRSNAGKSSFINNLFGKNVAKASKVPGKTQSINIFDFNKNTMIADLPGYGFAKKSKSDRGSWSKNSTDFLMFNKNVILVSVVVDIRREITDLDEGFLSWLKDHCSIPCIIIACKTDKLKSSSINKSIANIRSKSPVNCIDVFQCSNISHEASKNIRKFLEEFSSKR